MSSKVVSGLRAVRLVGDRADPTVPLAVGEIARGLGLTLSSASRLCAELDRADLLERGEAYGTYRLGSASIRLSGEAAAPFARVVRHALITLGQQTGETAFLAAPTSAGAVVVAAVVSAWTLYSPAEVGEAIADERSAVVRALRRDDGDETARWLDSANGNGVEIATPVRTPSGECVAALAVRLPVNRTKDGVRVARRALDAARRTLERTIAGRLEEGRPAPASSRDDAVSRRPAHDAIDAAVAVLRHLAAGPDGASGIAHSTGLRRDRVLRLLRSCELAGLVHTGQDGGTVRLGWAVHGWYRATAAPLMLERGAPLVAAAARRTGACAFITVLRGMRSVTLVEELEDIGDGLAMTPWLGRPCPITGADGGPTLVMDLDTDELAPLLPRRVSSYEQDEFLERVRAVTQDGVLAKESIEEAGLVSISAPIRDASGTVAAAACLVGTTEDMKPRIRRLEAAALELAAHVSALLTGRPQPG